MMCIPNLPKKVPVNSPGFTCEPNKIFMDDCNTCSCDESGSLARCTAMACDPNERHKRSASDEVADSHKKNLPVTPGNQCVPGTTWKEDCNTCFCSESGYAGCTLMGCFSLDDPKFANLNLAGDKHWSFWISERINRFFKSKRWHNLSISAP